MDDPYPTFCHLLSLRNYIGVPTTFARFPIIWNVSGIISLKSSTIDGDIEQMSP